MDTPPLPTEDPAGAVPAPPPPDGQVPFREALRFWWVLGWISFGGPAGQIATMHEELVVRRRWISDRRFLHALSYCMALPGPEAQQLATYVGWLLHGTKGGLVAGGLFVLPSIAVLLGLSWVYMAYGHVPAIDGVLAGFKPAVLAVILAASWRIGRRSIRTPFHLALALGALGALLLGVPFPFVVFGAALLGVLEHRLRQATAVAGSAAPDPHGAAPRPPGARYVVDDDTPPPVHARPTWARAARVVGVGVVLWGSAYGAVVLAGGAQGPLAVMATFFTVAALVTFGGAYAVLPYVAQVAIETHRWLLPAQMLDGLALGETTPGPLIMVVTFVGFVGAWQTLGPSAAWAGGLVATWFTFLPSFLFIFLGAPHIERLRGRLGWTAPLAAISAAVVGVIVHLAVYLARPVLVPDGHPSWFAIGAFLACAVALFGARWKVHWVVLAAGGLGLAAAPLR